jgi:predicted nuclease with TOPRIM domain
MEEDRNVIHKISEWRALQSHKTAALLRARKAEAERDEALSRGTELVGMLERAREDADEVRVAHGKLAEDYASLLVERDALRARIEKLVRVVRAVSDFYSGSLDHRPYYVQLAREALREAGINA